MRDGVPVNGVALDEYQASFGEESHALREDVCALGKVRMDGVGDA